jgi:hypothetical protein
MRSEHSYSQTSNLRSEANWFILKLYNIEAKRTGSIVILYLKQQQKSELSFFLNERQKTKGFDSKLSKFCHSYNGELCSHSGRQGKVDNIMLGPPAG